MLCAQATQAPRSAPLDGISVALAHHWLIRRRGGERVLEAFCDLFPHSDVFTLVHDPRGWQFPRRHPSPAAPRVHASFLQQIPGSRRHYPSLLPLIPWAARSLRLPAVDLVVCSDAALAKAMRFDPRSRVVCYCHSPMRYVWDLRDEYAQTLPAAVRWLWRPLTRWLRGVDRRAAQRIDLFIANSRTVADRIRRAYGRDADVIYPPVDVPEPPPPQLPREPFYLCVGHHVPYKRLDLAVEACGRLGRPLVVIGEGPEAARLARAAPAHVRFLGYQPVDVVQSHYLRARALLFPGVEDFGIVPVEAQAHGCPVVALGAGGATETVLDGQTGVLFAEPRVESLIEGMQRLDRTELDPRQLHRHARQFARQRFLDEIRGRLEQFIAAG